MLNYIFSVQIAHAEESHLGMFLNSTSSAFSGSGEYNTIFITLGAIVVIVIVNLSIYFWWKKDYFIRHDKNSPPALGLLFLGMGFITWFFYLFLRPQGKIVTCPYCKKQKLETLPPCFCSGQEAANYRRRLRTRPPRYSTSRLEIQPQNRRFNDRSSADNAA
jgi:hypothetical protein